MKIFRISMMTISGFLITLVLGVYLLQLNHAQYSASYTIPGVRGKVSYDNSGYITIEAAKALDAYFIMGFVQAKERLFQLEGMRLLSEGKLSQVKVTAKALDQRAQLINFNIDKVLQNMAEEDKLILQAFADGINSYKSLNPYRLGIEYYVMPKSVARKWTTLDVVRMFRQLSFELSVDFRDELRRYRLAKKYGPEKESQLRYPWYKEPYGHVFSADSADALVSLDKQQDKKNELAEHQILESSFEDLGDFQVDESFSEFLGGSNAWGLKGNDRKGKSAVLCNDPHLRYTNPGIWMLMRIKVPEFDVAGLVQPGLPFVLIGGTHSIAWGLTMSYVDAEDIIVSSRALNLPKLGTIGKNSAYFSWTPYYLEKEFVPSGFSKIYRSKNVDELMQTLEDSFEVPLVNATVADKDLNVAYKLVGKYPKRFALTPYFQQEEWLGVKNSEIMVMQDKVVSANQTILSRESSKELSYDFLPSLRAQRIDELLSENGENEITNHFAYQIDVKMPIPKDVLNYFNKNLNLNFDGFLNANSIPAHKFEEFHLELTKQYLTSLGLDEKDIRELMYDIRIEAQVLKIFNDLPEPVKYAGIARAALVDSPWGDVHFIDLLHPILGPLGFRTIKKELGGNAFTPRAESYNHNFTRKRPYEVSAGATGRVCFKYSEGGEFESYGIILGGNSGWIGSRYAKNLNDAWDKNQMVHLFDPGPTAETIDFN